MDMFEKLRVLADSAKFDVACTSSGTDRPSGKDGMGSASLGGICHSFAADGRCISLLKVLMTNACAYDCAYCVNRRSNDVPARLFPRASLPTLPCTFTGATILRGFSSARAC
jgi:predicted DNA-binding helix-hairpin-helix protein